MGSSRFSQFVSSDITVFPSKLPSINTYILSIAVVSVSCMRAQYINDPNNMPINWQCTLAVLRHFHKNAQGDLHCPVTFKAFFASGYLDLGEPQLMMFNKA